MFVSAAGLSWMTMLERCWPKLPHKNRSTDPAYAESSWKATRRIERSRFRQLHRLHVIVVDDDCAPRMTRKKIYRKIRMTFGQWTLVKVPQKAVKVEIHVASGWPCRHMSPISSTKECHARLHLPTDYLLYCLKLWAPRWRSELVLTKAHSTQEFQTCSPA
jgi:hypothetical protein